MIPDKLKLAISEYYISRSIHNLASAKPALEKLKWAIDGQCTEKIPPDPIPAFDKAGMLKKIDQIAMRYGFGMSAISGTFWFTKGRSLFKFTEESFVAGGTREKVARKAGAK